MNACPPAEQLLEFAAGRLSDDSQASVETHIDACAACRASLSALAKSDVPHHTSFGRYRLETVLGSGGMGIVYRAWDPQLARPVAIKVVRQANADSQLRTRLVREAQSLARLSHPNVCHCYDVGADGDEVWVAMELIDGTTLRAWATPDRPRADLLAVLLGAAEGIAAAHDSGLVHRDIKPENVLVTRTGRPVVTDFGLARIDIPVDPNASTMSGDPLLTATGAIVGTPAYLAPEQLTGDALDARVDQFAWSVMAWELLTGTRPFPIIAAIRLDAIRVGITPPASLAKPLAAALIRGMALDPRDRFPTMRALIDALSTTPAAPSRSRTPFLVAGAAVAAAGATVIAWQALKTHEPTASPSSSPPVAQQDANIVVAPPDADAAVAAVAQPSPSSPTDAPVVAVDAPTDVVATKATMPAAAPLPKKPPKPAAGTATSAQPTTPAPASTQPPLRPLNNPRYSVTRAYAVLVSFCRVAMDAKHPDPMLGKDGIVDFGTVTRKETVIATLVDRETYAPLVEVKGQRGTYQFDASSISAGALGIFDAPIGQPVAVCVDPMRTERSDLYKLPANWQGGLDIMASVLPLTATPPLDQLKRWSPLHIYDLKLEVSGDKGKLQIPAASHYLVRAQPLAADGARWDMKGWWLEVGNVKGADLVAAGKRVWFVIERPTFEPAPDGQKPKLVAKAVLVLDEIIPH